MKAKKEFPAPHRLTEGTTRWRLSELAAWDGTEHTGTDTYLRAVEVAQRYGVSNATIWRWAAAAERRGSAAA